MALKLNSNHQHIIAKGDSPVKLLKETTKFEIAYTHPLGPDDKPRHINAKMDLELSIYKEEVEAKFLKSEMRHYTFPRLLVSTELTSEPKPSVSSKDILSKLLIKYQQLQTKPSLKSKKPIRSNSSLITQ